MQTLNKLLPRLLAICLLSALLISVKAQDSTTLAEPLQAVQMPNSPNP